jgi:hypothetical protein
MFPDLFLSRNIKKYLLSFFLIFEITLQCISQSPCSINLKEIRQRKVRRYISLRGIDQMQNFNLLQPSWKKGTDISDFHLNEKVFFLKNSLPDVWESYRGINPAETWNHHSIRLGLLISKCTNSVTYTRNQVFPEIDTGQVYFLNLRLIKGIFNIPVAFEITNIDFSRQLMEFSYIENNKSLGKQSIRFFDHGDGKTRIVHQSYFRSGSNFRDNFLYPIFHKKFIREFHRNMQRNSNRSKVV